MKILLDECIPFAVFEYLKGKKLIVAHVKQTEWKGTSNSILYEKAQSAYQIFITTDRHFSHKEKFKPKKNFGVIYLRVAPTVGPLLVEALDLFLRKHTLEEMIGKLVTVRRTDFTIR